MKILKCRLRFNILIRRVGYASRPPDINLAPSMDDLSNATRNLTLEKSPRVSRRGINSAGIKNDSSSSLTAMNPPAGGTVMATADDRG